MRDRLLFNGYATLYHLPQADNGGGVVDVLCDRYKQCDRLFLDTYSPSVLENGDRPNSPQYSHHPTQIVDIQRCADPLSTIKYTSSC